MHINFIQNLIDKIRGKNGNLIFIDNEKARANFVEQQLKQIELLKKKRGVLNKGAKNYRQQKKALKQQSFFISL